MRRVGVLLILAGVTGLGLAPGAAAGANVIRGSVLAARIRKEPVTLTDATVTGDVGLRGRTVSHSFTCHGCTFTGNLKAQGATFKSIVDLRTSTVKGTVDFSDATFLAPVVFDGPPGGDETFTGKANFGLATFRDTASFEGTMFGGGANFQLARFDAGTTFAGGTFSKALPKATGAANFTRAIFLGSADFSGQDFCCPAIFAMADFSGPATFANVHFDNAAQFHQAAFAKGATFFAADFLKASNVMDAFSEIQAGGDLDYSYANFARPTDFETTVATGTISFHGATLSAPNTSFQGVKAGGFDMSVGTAMRAVGTDSLPSVLAMIESTAKARGDLGVANDAHYESLVIASRSYSWPVRILDFVFYRTLAGYLVRPFQPLLALLALAALVTVFQLARSTRAPSAPNKLRGLQHARTRTAAALGTVPLFGNAYLQTLALIGPGGASSADDRASRRIEIFAYRLLFVCALIGFANSNPTLRQMFDAIR